MLKEQISPSVESCQLQYSKLSFTGSYFMLLKRWNISYLLAFGNYAQAITNPELRATRRQMWSAPLIHLYVSANLLLTADYDP